MTAIEKLNEALGAITAEQKGLEGENLILSLKAIKSVVKAMETMAKMTKEESEKTEAEDVENAEETHDEEPPAEAVEEVKEEEQEVDEYGLPQTDDLHSSTYRRAMFAYDNAPQEKKDVYDELAKYSVKDYFMILGEGRSGWCEYSKNMLFDTIKVEQLKYGKAFNLNCWSIHNPADCRYGTRNCIHFHEDGKMYLNGMPCKVALVKRGRGGQWLAIFDEQAVDDNGKVNKAQIMEYRDPELLKKLIFG